MEKFIEKTPIDGRIYISNTEIYKVKPSRFNTVDLKYCKKHNIFLDNDNLVYYFEKPTKLKNV